MKRQKDHLGEKKCSINVEEVETFCEIFLLAQVVCQTVWLYSPLSSVAIREAGIPPASLSH